MNCKTSKSQPKDVVELIKFGSGGGFSGKENMMILNENGSLTSTDGVKLKKIKKEIIVQLISNIQVLGIDKLNYNTPGNIYQFIEIKRGNDWYRMAWDPQSTEVPASLKLFYNNLNNIFKINSK